MTYFPEISAAEELAAIDNLLAGRFDQAAANLVDIIPVDEIVPVAALIHRLRARREHIRRVLESGAEPEIRRLADLINGRLVVPAAE